jgi:hypothetical protein
MTPRKKPLIPSCFQMDRAASRKVACFTAVVDAVLEADAAAAAKGQLATTRGGTVLKQAGCNCCVCKAVLIRSSGVVTVAATQPAIALAVNVACMDKGAPLPSNACFMASLVETMTIPYGILVAKVTGNDRTKEMGPSCLRVVLSASDNEE